VTDVPSSAIDLCGLVAKFIADHLSFSASKQIVYDDNATRMICEIRSWRIPGGFDRKVNLQLRGATVFCTRTVTVGSRVETHFVLPTPYALSSP